MVKRTIPIFLSADNEYAPFIATTIVSICEHTREFVDFYVLDGGINDENKNKIVSLKNLFSNFSIEFLSIEIDKIFSDFSTNLHYSKTMFARFFIPQLKSNLNKVLYSDVDVIFLDDIRKMYDEDLQGFALGAVPEIWLNDYEKSKMKEYWQVDVNHDIFASGNLIFDCEKWRNLGITKQLFEINSKKENSDLWVDQILLNKVFDNNYKILPAKYCYTIQHDTCYGKADDTVICHFNGAIKPWHINENTKTQNMPYLQEFWNYAKMTPFYQELKSKTLDENVQKDLLAKLQAWRFKIKLANKGKLFNV